MTFKQISFSTLGLLLLAGCNTTTPATDTTEPQTQVTQEAQTLETQAEPEEAMTPADYTIDMFSFGYSLENITASPGDTITIKLTNSKGTHNFVIDELEVESDTTQAGEETQVTIEIPQGTEPGTEYAFYCSIGNHRAQGMEGTLTIE